MNLRNMHPFYRTRVKLILSFVAVCLLVGITSLVVGASIIDSAVLSEATDRISQDLNAVTEIYDSYRRLIATMVETVADDPGLIDAIERDDRTRLRFELERLESAAGIDFAGFTFPRSSWTRLTSRSLPGAGLRRSGRSEPFLELCFERRTPVSGTFVVSREFLETEHPALSARARIELIPTERAAERTDSVETDGMALIATAPLFSDGEIITIVYGGVLLNRDQELVDRIRDTVFRGDTHDGASIGTATIFFRDLRIATNVRNEQGARAIGTRVSEVVKKHVLDQGERWSDRAFVVNAWYRTAYDPIVDPMGNRIGMLYVGVLDEKYASLRRRTLAVFSAITTAGVVVAVLFGYVLGRILLKPINRLIAASNRVREGDFDPDIGPIVNDELGVLQQTFKTMLQSLKERTARQLEESENKLRQSEKQATVGRLAAGVAHEINNPLTSVLTFSHLLLERDDIPQDVRDDLEVISESTQRVRTIVRDLLDFSRQSEIHPAPTDVGELVEATVKLVKNQATAKDIEIVVECADNVPLKTLDSNQMQSVLINLLINAIDATDPGGTITVSTSLSLAFHRQGTEDSHRPGIEISVSDTGRGIEPEHLQRLFDPFFTTKPSGEGTGLGLAVSLSIVERHGGDIRVRSTPGRGSTFVVWLPSDEEGSTEGRNEAPAEGSQ